MPTTEQLFLRVASDIEYLNSTTPRRPFLKNRNWVIISSSYLLGEVYKNVKAGEATSIRCESNVIEINGNKCISVESANDFCNQYDWEVIQRLRNVLSELSNQPITLEFRDDNSIMIREAIL